MTDTKSLHDDISPALLERLGKVVYHWAYVETMESSLLAFMLHADLGLIHVITARASGNALTEWLRTLAPTVFINEETREGLNKLFTRIDEARGDRNALAHGLWTRGGEPDTAMVMTIRWDRSEVMKHELVTLGDLNGLLEEIEQIYRELVWLGNKLGFHPIRPGT